MRTALIVRSALLGMPWLYRAIQTPAAWRVRHRLHPAYEAEYPELRSWLPGTFDRPIIDVGGNFGQSVSAFRRLFPEAPVLSFEPNRALAYALRRTFAHDAAVQVRPFGLAEARSQGILHLPSYNGVAFPGLASLDVAEAHRWFGPDTVIRYREDRFRTRELSIELVPLDDLGLAPGLVKVDVEGAEARVIEGARDTMARCRPVLLIESRASLERVRALLRGLELVNLEFLGGSWVVSEGRRLNQLFVPAELLGRGAVD